MMSWLLGLLGICQHREMWREHRDVEGRTVACYVCACGHVQPIVKRTADEHMKAFPARSGRV